MRALLSLVCLVPLLACSASDRPAASATLDSDQPQLFGHWTHSREEDRGDVHVYRPADREFPPSRFRESFEIHRDGTFVLYTSGRGDAYEPVHGRWTRDAETIHISFSDKDVADFDITVVSSTKERLELRSPRL